MSTTQESNRGERTSRKSSEQLEFNSFKQVRVVLFRERFGQERRLLFDTKCVRKRRRNNNEIHLHQRRTKENSIENSFKLNEPESEFIYEWRRQSSDEELLREMIFGSISTVYYGTALKIHLIRSPFQVLISLVFPAPLVTAFRLGGSEQELSNEVLPTRLRTCSRLWRESNNYVAHSVPVDVPSRSILEDFEGSYMDSSSFQSSDEYTSLPFELQESEMKPLPRSGSFNSLNRRLQRNRATSIELGFPTAEDNVDVHEDEQRAKLGLSVIISLSEENEEEERSFQDFFFTHITFIENHVLDLKNTVLKAYLTRRMFTHYLYEGAVQLQKSIQELYTAPRLQFPEWLTIVSSTNHHDLSNVFINKFASLLKEHDKKETNFFVSTLITAVLTHHLAWVPTVVPSTVNVSTIRSCHKPMSDWVTILSKSRPYNPLWVQLGDLYGALTQPLKLVKVVITGSKTDVVMKFLKILSYFIRCSEVCEKFHEKAAISVADEIASGDAAGSKCDPSSVCDRTEKNASVCERTEKTASNTMCQGKESIISSVKDSNSQLFIHKCYTPIDLQSADFLRTGTELDPDQMKSLNSYCKQCCAEDLKSILRNSSPEKFTSLLHYDKNSQYILQHLPVSFKVISKHPVNSNFDSIGYESLEDLSMHLTESVQFSNATVLPDKENMKCQSRDRKQVLPFCCKKCGEVYFLIYGQNSVVSEKCSFSRLSKQLSEQHLSDMKDSTGLNSLLNHQSGSPEKKCFASVLCKCHKISDVHTSCIKLENVSSVILEGQNNTQLDSLEEGYHSMEEVQSSKCEHLEGASSQKHWCPEGLSEFPLPRCSSSEILGPTLYRSFGWSLMGSVGDHYIKDFCLQGINGPASEEEIHSDLLRLTQVHILGEPVSEAVCILASTDDWTVQVLSSEYSEGDKPGNYGLRAGMSTLVSNMCESILNLKEVGVPAETCVIHLEDRLQELYCQSSTFVDYMLNCATPTAVEKVASVLNLDASDIPLLLAIASTQSPCLNMSK